VLKFWKKIKDVIGDRACEVEGGMKNWLFDQYLFISKTIQDKTTVTMEDEYELLCNLANGAISNNLEQP